MKLFGYQITKENENSDKNLRSIPSDDTDGASTVGNFYAYGVDFGGGTITDNPVQLITKYRELEQQPELDLAIQDIINEAFSYDEDTYPVKINLDALDELSDNTKKIIIDNFEQVLEMLNFKDRSYEIFRHWYVDGRLFYQKVIDVNNPKDGIIGLNYIDPRKIKKVRERRNINSDKLDAKTVFPKFSEYYLYDPSGLGGQNTSALKIAPDMISYVHSGIFDKTGKIVISYLHKAIKPFNALRMAEDSMLIYRLTRAAEKRIFNVECGKVPKHKAEQHLAETMKRFQNKMVYDPNTGEVKQTQRFMTMFEDFWFSRRDGVGTTVDTLPGGTALNAIDDIELLKSNLYDALNVPKSRFENNMTIPGVGRTSEVTRDELRFSKFISRLRKRFSGLFDDILGTHLILQGIVTAKEWEDIKKKLVYDFLEDNNYAEFKETDIWQNRIQTFMLAVPLVQDRYLSRAWVRKQILRLSDEEWEEMRKEIEEEMDDPLFQNLGMGMDQQGFEQPDPNNPQLTQPTAPGPQGTVSPNENNPSGGWEPLNKNEDF
jgi:hypothetical protein